MAKLDLTVPNVTLRYDAVADDGRTLAETTQAILDTNSLEENEFVEFTDKRVMATKVKTFFALLVSALAGVYNKVNRGKALDQINAILGENFDKLQEAQEAYKLQDKDGKAFRLADSDVMSEPDVVRGIINTPNIASSIYLPCAIDLAKSVKAFIGYESAVSESDAVNLLNLGVNRWLQSALNPHRTYAMTEYFDAVQTVSKKEKVKVVETETVQA